MNDVLENIRIVAQRSVARVFSLVVVFALAACGGGGGESKTSGGVAIEDMDGGGISTGTYTQFSASTAGAISDLRVIALNADGDFVGVLAATLDHENATISGSGLAGDLESGRSVINLDGGGTATLTNPASTEFARFVQTSGTGNDIFGVVGVPTLGADLPIIDAATYNGFVLLAMNNENASYQLNGDARITATWSDGGSVTTLLNGFSGEVNGALNQNVGGSVTITDANLNNGGFSGGALSMTGSAFDTNESLTVDHSGQFFGSNGDEVGGVLTVQSGAAGNFNLTAIFAAE